MSDSAWNSVKHMLLGAKQSPSSVKLVIFPSPALIRDWPQEIVNDNWYGIGPPVLKPFTTLDSSFLNTLGKSAENIITVFPQIVSSLE